MKLFVQFNGETGEIIATVIGDNTPIFENQLILDEYQDLTGKMVDVETLEIIDSPPEEE